MGLLKVHGVFCWVRGDIRINKNNDNNNNNNNNNSKNYVIWMLVSDVQYGYLDVAGYKKI